MQHRLLNRIADLVDTGDVVCTVRRREGPLSVESLRRAHAMQESGKAVGKTVLGGF